MITLQKVADYVAIHDRLKNRNDISYWYFFYDGRRHRIALQKYRGRLYAVGCAYHGHTKIVDFEEPLGSILRMHGPLKPLKETGASDV